MINAVNDFQNVSEDTGSVKYNFVIAKEASASVFDKTVTGGKQGILNFDWLNIDKNIKNNIFNTGSLEKILGTQKVQCKSPSITEKEREKAIEEEKNHISKTTTERTAYNTNQLKKAKVPERQIYKYLTYDGHVTFEGKKILKEHGLSYK